MAKAKAKAKEKAPAKAKEKAPAKAKAKAPAKARAAKCGHQDILGGIAARARQAYKAGDTVVYMISEEDYNAIAEMAEG